MRIEITALREEKRLYEEKIKSQNEKLLATSSNITVIEQERLSFQEQLSRAKVEIEFNRAQGDKSNKDADTMQQDLNVAKQKLNEMIKENNNLREALQISQREAAHQQGDARSRVVSGEQSKVESELAALREHCNKVQKENQDNCLLIEQLRQRLSNALKSNQPVSSQDNRRISQVSNHGKGLSYLDEPSSDSEIGLNAGKTLGLQFTRDLMNIRGEAVNFPKDNLSAVSPLFVNAAEVVSAILLEEMKNLSPNTEISPKRPLTKVDTTKKFGSKTNVEEVCAKAALRLISVAIEAADRNENGSNPGQMGAVNPLVALGSTSVLEKLVERVQVHCFGSPPL